MTTAPLTLTQRFTAEVARLTPGAPGLLVAVSGGGDSVAALKLAVASGAQVTAAHFDHQLRADSDEDAAFVGALCERLGIPLVAGGADVAGIAAREGQNVYDAGRRLRYSFLHKALRELPKGTVIVVAHTVEDQAETLLLQLMRGVAHPGGMPRRRGAVIRPLLNETREGLREYLRGRGQEWLEDPTNIDTRLARSWVRLELLPLMEARSPGVTGRLAGTADLQREARAALQELAKRRFPRETIRLVAYAATPPALRKAAVAARLLGVKSQPSRQLLAEIDAVAGLATAAAAAGEVLPPQRRSLPGGARLEIAYGALRVAPAPGAQLEPVRLRSVEQLPSGLSPAVMSAATDLVLRGRLRGDRIRLAGGTKLLSDLLIDLKVPLSVRESLRVVAAGSDLYWVEGVAVAERFRAAGGPALLVDDHAFMRRAIKEAELALQAGEVPVGAVLMSAKGELLAAAHNRTEGLADPTAHAELLALRAAAELTGDWRLPGATLYVTLEPCPMCLGAVLQTHLRRVVYGADNVREGALGSVTDLTGAGFKRELEVRGGVQAKAAAELLKRAFNRGEGPASAGK